MKLFACERAAMEISGEEEEKEEDKEIRRQDEVIVGERIELHSLGLSALSLTWFTGERQVRHQVSQETETSCAGIQLCSVPQQGYVQHRLL